MNALARRVLANNHALIALFAAAWAAAVVGGFEAWRSYQGHDAAAELRDAIVSAVAGDAEPVRSSAPSGPAHLDAPSYLLFERSGPDDVLAARGGKVDFAGLVDGMGTVVMIDHGDGLVSVYRHLGGAMVAEGESVNAGSAIGQAGPAPGVGPFVVWFEAALSDGQVAAPQAILGAASPEAQLFRRR